MLNLLRKKTAAYAGRHADDERAPTGTPCADCGATEPSPDAKLAPDEQPMKLACCSKCQAWFCGGACFSLHTFRPPPRLFGPVKASWWKRVIGRG
jgi:hypothetical protein